MGTTNTEYTLPPILPDTLPYPTLPTPTPVPSLHGLEHPDNTMSTSMKTTLVFGAALLSCTSAGDLEESLKRQGDVFSNQIPRGLIGDGQSIQEKIHKYLGDLRNECEYHDRFNVQYAENTVRLLDTVIQGQLLSGWE